MRSALLISDRHSSFLWSGFIRRRNFDIRIQIEAGVHFFGQAKLPLVRSVLPDKALQQRKGVGRKRGGGVRRGDRVERLVKDIRLGVREISMRVPDTR